ncbi:MAG: ABC transporter substrate-binding protein, partial [Bradyrhizobium sp.]
MATALATLAFAGLAVVNEFGEPARPVSGDETRRVFYVSYVDEPDDDRGRINFGRLKDALDSLDANGKTAPFALDFVQVVVGGPQTIDGTLRQLVQRKPAAIVATSDDVLQAAKAVTQSIPIVFMSYGDPVAAGDVRSIAAPGVRRTGFTIHVPMLQKAIELLVDGYPAAKHIGVLVDSLAASQPGQRRQFQEARSAFAREIQV